MARLEELLKTKGYTDADLESLKPMLADQRFRSTLEASFTELETERDTLKGKDAEWDKWRTEVANPRIAQTEQDAATARRKAADLEEQLKIAKEWGLIQEATNPNKGQNPPPENKEIATPFDPKAHKLVTYDDIGRYADAEGEAIAMANDLAQEYSHLYGGKSLIEYEGQDGKRGMRALRMEAKAAQKNLDVYVAEKFNFTGKRTEMAAERQKKAEDAIRADERSKMAAEFGNPALRTSMPSRQPFIPTRENANADPWTKTSRERKAERIQAAIRTQSQVQ